jgi:hypothetical protein
MNHITSHSCRPLGRSEGVSHATAERQRWTTPGEMRTLALLAVFLLSASSAIAARVKLAKRAANPSNDERLAELVDLGLFDDALRLLREAKVQSTFGITAESIAKAKAETAKLRNKLGLPPNVLPQVPMVTFDLDNSTVAAVAFCTWTSTNNLSTFKVQYLPQRVRAYSVSLDDHWSLLGEYAAGRCMRGILDQRVGHQHLIGVATDAGMASATRFFQVKGGKLSPVLCGFDKHYGPLELVERGTSGLGVQYSFSKDGTTVEEWRSSGGATWSHLVFKWDGDKFNLESPKEFVKAGPIPGIETSPCLTAERMQ